MLISGGTGLSIPQAQLATPTSIAAAMNTPMGVAMGMGGALAGSFASSLSGSFPYPYPPRLWPNPPLNLSTSLLRDAPFSFLPFLHRQSANGLPSSSPAQSTMTSSSISPITAPAAVSSAGNLTKSKSPTG